MKKQLFVAATALVSAGTLAACNTGAEGNDEIEQLLTESNEAMAELNSYKMETNVTSPEEEGGEEMTSIVQLTRDPLSFEVSQNSPNPMTGEMEELKEFFYDGTFYTEEPTIGGWVQMDGEEAGISDGNDVRPAEQQTDYLLEHLDSLSMEETDDSYLITSEGTEEDAAALALILAGDAEGETGFDVSEFSYQLTIDKETMIQEDVAMTLGLEMPEEGMGSVQEVSTQYSQFNELDEISVPEDVIDEAIGMDEALEQMEEQQAELEEEQGQEEEQQEEQNEE